MMRNPAWPLLLALLLPLAFGAAGCFPQPRMAPGSENTQPQLDDASRRARYSQRPPINTTRNTYEGSLWRGAASWGNLMRDHRARYKGDLLTITDLLKIVNVPAVKADQPNAPGQPQQQQQAQAQQAQQPQQQQAPQPQVDPVIAFLRAQEERRQKIEQEQNEILRSIEQIEVEVVRVLGNGNMLVRGVHPPIFRDRNNVKYVVTLEGIVRPTDVDDANVVPAPKLSKAEYKIRRLVRRSLIPGLATDVARAAGRKGEAEFADRLSNFLSGPSRTSQVPTR